MFPAGNHAVTLEVADLIGERAFDGALEVVLVNIGALQAQAELAVRRIREAIVQRHVDPVGFDDAEVGVASDDVVERAVGIAHEAVLIGTGLIKHGGFRERLDLVGNVNPPEIQAHRQVVHRLINEAQGDVAGFLRRQILIAADLVEELLTAIAPAVAARLHYAAGTQHRVVVVALGEGDAAR